METHETIKYLLCLESTPMSTHFRSTCIQDINTWTNKFFVRFREFDPENIENAIKSVFVETVDGKHGESFLFNKVHVGWTH